MLTWWYSGFEPVMEKVLLHHIWVLLPGFPLAMWNRDAFEAVGNHFGCFQHISDDTLKCIDKRVGWILVEIDMAQGLFEKLDIEWRGFIYVQTVDYWGIPFRCSNCKRVGHLW